MIVYLWGSPGKTPVPYHVVTVCPAGHRPTDCPEEDWWDKSQEKPKAREFMVEFFNGQAEVSDPVGKYLIETKQAQKTRLVLPNSWGG